ncbi:MAG: Maf family protein [Candidatus Beckwithbacteria bacterium]|nr:Maf family protein [Candidatus Beckwithbacteria bacterium]
MQIILASDSPRRKQLLALMGLEFKAMSHRVDEKIFSVKDPEELVGQLAIVKALSVSGNLVIASDLVVSLGNKIMGKPKNKKQAREFLKDLSGKTHRVWCGICVSNKDKTLMSVAVSQVKMKKYSDEIIEKYIKKFQVLDKGGAYAIQFELAGYGSLVASFKGGITTIIGLPLDHLENLLNEFGVKVKSDWRKKCKIETGYEY